MLDYLKKMIEDLPEAYWVARLEELDRLRVALEAEMAAERAMIDLGVTYDTDHYEIWVGPDWLDLTDSTLETFFTPQQAAFIRQRKGDLSPYHALIFSHPYTPDIGHDDIDRQQLQYVDLRYIGDEDDGD